MLWHVEICHSLLWYLVIIIYIVDYPVCGCLSHTHTHLILIPFNLTPIWYLFRYPIPILLIKFQFVIQNHQYLFIYQISICYSCIKYQMFIPFPIAIWCFLPRQIESLEEAEKLTEKWQAGRRSVTGFSGRNGPGVEQKAWHLFGNILYIHTHIYIYT